MMPTIMLTGEWQIDELRLTIRGQRDEIDHLTAESLHYQKLAGELIEGNARLRAALAQIADSDCHYDPAATLMRIARDVLANEQKS